MMDGFLSDWLQTLLHEGTPMEIESRKACPRCQLTWSAFRRTGRLGCAHCYETFRRELLPSLEQIQGKLEHTGKLPVRHGKELMKERRVQSLRNEMQRRVEEQNFERAAKIRDEIRKLEAEEGNSK